MSGSISQVGVLLWELHPVVDHAFAGKVALKAVQSLLLSGSDQLLLDCSSLIVCGGSPSIFAELHSVVSGKTLSLESADILSDFTSALIMASNQCCVKIGHVLVVDIHNAMVQVVLIGRDALLAINLTTKVSWPMSASSMLRCVHQICRKEGYALQNYHRFIPHHNSKQNFRRDLSAVLSPHGTDRFVEDFVETRCADTLESAEDLPHILQPWLSLCRLVSENGVELEGKRLLLYIVSEAGVSTGLSIDVCDNPSAKFNLTRLQCSLFSSVEALRLGVNLSTSRRGTEDEVGLCFDVQEDVAESQIGNSAVPRIPRSDTQVWASGKPNLKVVITGVSAALPGRNGEVFTPNVNNIQRIIDGESFITRIPEAVLDSMLEKNVIVQKRLQNGLVETIPVSTHEETINVCASLGRVDLSVYGIPESIVSTMDRAVQVSVAAGLEALIDAGLVTAAGGWMLPESMQNSTGIVYATSFPALDTAIAEVSKYFSSNTMKSTRATEMVTELRRRLVKMSGTLSQESEDALKQLLETASECESDIHSVEPYAFDRKFLFRVLVLGNAQLAQIVKARGPNMQTNAACAGATQAIALAYDLIQVGRAERVIVVAGDNASSDNLMPWLGNGFRILGAATTCSDVSEAAQPFSAGRSGMILGSGGIGMILESEAGARRRHSAALIDSHRNPTTEVLPCPVYPFKCRLLGTLLSNSAYHGAAMDRTHIASEMERFIASVETEHGIRRSEIARMGVYFSHETGTHASPSSSCAANEIYGLRQVFGQHLSELLILNTKGFTGHPMGVSFEDVVAVEVLRTGRVPPIANFRSVDPNLGIDLKMSRGGEYPCKYALRFAAGFGSQIALALYGID